MAMTIEKPACVSHDELEEMLGYLDDLRESGATNMYGAAAYLDDEFPQLRNDHRGHGSSKNARQVLGYWMKTFSERHDI